MNGIFLVLAMALPGQVYHVQSTTGWHGTASSVAATERETYLLTANHVVAGKDDLWLFADKTIKGTVVDRDIPNDLALVRVEAPLPVYKVAGTHWAPVVSAPLLSLGHDRAGPLKTHDARVVAVYSNRTFCTPSPVPGRSGGPLLTPDGYLAGICLAYTSTNTGIYASTGPIYAFLDRNGLGRAYKARTASR